MEYLQESRKRCQCGAMLGVKNVKNEAARNVVCPRCHASVRVSFMPRIDDTPAQRPIQSPPSPPNMAQSRQQQRQPQQQRQVYSAETQFATDTNNDSSPFLQSVTITCRCGTRLMVNNGTVPIASRQVTCPICHSVNVASFAPQAQPPKQALLMLAGQYYPLREGENIVGRNATEGCFATVRINSIDRSMSRNHVVVRVIRQPDGNVMASIKKYPGCSSKTLVQGVPLGETDEIMLLNGYDIVFGHVPLKFIIQ